MIDVLPPKRRQAPVQKRSEETVERILLGAEMLICQVPLDFVTAGRIAKAAGISIGSLYRFFGDKQAVFDALARRHLKQLRERLESRVLRPLEHSQEGKDAGFNQFEFLENVIDTYVSYLEENEPFRALSLGPRGSVGAMARHVSPIAGLPGVLKSVLMERMRVPHNLELELRMQVFGEAGERLIAFAFEQKTSEARHRVVQEMKDMLTGYLFVRKQ